MTNKAISLTIGTLAKTCGVSTPTIRYYEKIGLLPTADRSRSDQRRYGQIDIDRLNFVRRSRAFGFSTAQVRTLLSVPNGSVADCHVSKCIAQDRIHEIRQKVADLLALEQELKAVIETCQTVYDDQNDQVCAAFTQMQARSPRTPCCGDS